MPIAITKAVENLENDHMGDFIKMNDPYRSNAMTQGRNLYAGSNTIDHQSEEWHHNPRTSAKVRRSNTILGSL